MSIVKTGFSRLCITPPLGTAIWGYYEKRNTKGVLDDLHISALAIDDGETRAVIMSAEILELTTEQDTRMRKAVAEFCNLPMEAVFLSCSHTHTGPVIGKSIQGEQNEDYNKFLENQIRDAAYYAFEDLKETEFSVGVGEAKGLSFVRRYRMKDGSVHTNPGVGNPDISEPLGQADHTVNLIKMERAGADDIYVVSFGTHADTVGGEYISADWPGFVCSSLEKALDNVKCIFMLGVQGNVNHVNPNPTEGQKKGTAIDFDSVPRGYAHAQYMGRAIAGAVLQICDKTEPVKDGKVQFVNKVVTMPSNRENDRLEEAEKIMELHNAGRDSELPYEGMELTTIVAEAARIVGLKNGPDSFNYNVSAISFGDMAFVGFPGEPFVEIGRRVQDGSPKKMTITCALTNGGGSYFPTSSAMDEGGYEAKSCSLKKGADDILVNSAIEILRNL